MHGSALVYPDASFDFGAVVGRSTRLGLAAIKRDPVELEQIKRVPGVPPPCVDRKETEATARGRDAMGNHREVELSPGSPQRGARAGQGPSAKEADSGHTERVPLGIEFCDVQQVLGGR